MSSRSIRPFLLLLVLLPLNSLLATGINDVRWKGHDFVMGFADSVRYTVDLAESDSTRVVLRLSGVEPGTGFAQRQIAGPDRISALLTTSPDGLRVTITSPTRIGYSTIWHPYSNRLVVHTFDWSRLSYGEEQYHKGLLAYEGRYNIAAEEMLKVAEATGETRARTALGTMYLGRGEDSLAARYLDSAVTADDHAALAELRRRRGDSATAQRHADMARMMIADEIRIAGAAPSTPADEDETPAPVSRGSEARSKNEMYYLGGGVLLLLLIIGAVIFFTRRPKAPANVAEGRIAPRRTDAPQPDAPVVTERVAPVRDPEPIPVPEPLRESIDTAPASGEVVVDPVVAPIRDEASITQPLPRPVVVESPQPIETMPDPTPVEPSRLEPSSVELSSIEPVAGEPSLPSSRFPSVTTVEELEPLEESDADIAPIVTRHPGEPASTEPASAEPHPHRGPRLPSQAAALQRKIKSVRRDAPAPAEPTVYAARRLNVSRDNIELRKMMEAARRAQE